MKLKNSSRTNPIQFTPPYQVSLLIGAILIYIAFHPKITSSDIVKYQAKTDGTVVELNSYNQPIIDYRWSGKNYSNTWKIASNPPKYIKGDYVELYVHPENPNRFVIDSLSDRWLATIVLGSLGLLALVVASWPFLSSLFALSISTKGILLGVMILGMAQFLIGAFLLSKQCLSNDKIPVKGEVTELVKIAGETRGGKTSYMWSPRVSYRKGGQIFYHLSPVKSHSPKLKIGDSVDLLISPTNSRDIVIDNFADRWLGGLLFSTLGLVTFAVIFVVRRRIVKL